ncbi:MAG: Glu-tRNA(Gln) amidotransferase subunit GatE [Thermoplasmatota archaeon]
MSDQVICGLEIHQQLDTEKLFCSCRSDLNEEVGPTIERRLRPAQSEMGKVDRAALAEAEKRLRFRYQAPHGVSCLVEADEEPPHAADEEATDAALTVAALVNSQVVDEIHFMRKIVIDGSNTTGFQRTALVAMHGTLEVNGKNISVPTICLEEDAARKVQAGKGEVTYRLDRLGIPLIEIATGPDMRSPEEVKEVAQLLGSIMRATRKVKRGIGSIREDLNISVPGGARVEIKGVQELRKLPLYVRNEMDRQNALLQVRDILKERGVEPVRAEVADVSEVFRDTGSKVISSSLSKGGKVMALPLPGFQGVLRGDGLRLGAELAQRAVTKGVKGIFHTDELPGYGITPEEVDRIREELGLGPEEAFAICAEDSKKARRALEAAAERANEALEGVPEETRDPQPDCTTRYSRPLPGAERMYPETDVPPVTIGPDRRERIMADLPELPGERASRLAGEYDIHGQIADQMVREGMDEAFEEIASAYGKGAVTSAASTTFTYTFSELEREDLDPCAVDQGTIREVFDSLAEERFAKEALPDLFRLLCQGRSLDQAVEELGLEGMGDQEAQELVASIVAEREDFVRERGMSAVGPLMGVVMEQLKGKVDGKEASELVKREIQRLLG